LSDSASRDALNRLMVDGNLSMKGLRARNAATVRAAVESDIRDGYARLSRYIAERGAVAAELSAPSAPTSPPARATSE
jgi:hypothetical protein